MCLLLQVLDRCHVATIDHLAALLSPHEDPATTTLIPSSPAAGTDEVETVTAQLQLWMMQ